MNKDNPGYVGYLLAGIITVLTFKFFDARLGLIPSWGFLVIVVITLFLSRYTFGISPSLGINLGGAVVPVVASLLVFQYKAGVIGPALITTLIGIGLFYVAFTPSPVGSLTISPVAVAVILFFLAFMMAVLTQKHSLLLNLIPITTMSLFGGDFLRASRSKQPMIVGYYGINDAIWITFGLLSIIYFIVTLGIL
ncbi:MAG: hypothetical protein JRM72_01340 [Nitrososphaerota archaeon]|nr:hypothetical protein [Nitrososphaerota archaeon]